MPGTITALVLRAQHLLDSTSVITEEKIRSLSALCEALGTLVSSPQLPRSILDLAVIFTHESKGNRDVLTFPHVPCVADLWHKHHEIACRQTTVGNILEALARLPDAQSGSLTFSKLILGYVAEVSLAIANMHNTRDATMQYQAFEYLDRVLRLVLTPTHSGYLTDETRQALQHIQNHAIRNYLNSSEPLSDEITHALAACTQTTQELSRCLIRLTFVLSAAGNTHKDVLPKAAESTKTFLAALSDNPFTPFLTNALDFLSQIESQDERYFNSEPLALPDSSDIQIFIRSCIDRFVESSFPQINYLLLQARDESKGVVWVTSKHTAEIDHASQVLCKLTQWVQLFLFVAHKARFLDLIVRIQGQQIFLNQAEAHMLKQFLSALTGSTLELGRWATQLDRSFHDLRRSPRKFVDHEHDVLHQLEQICRHINTIHQQAIVPLQGIDQLLPKLMAVHDRMMQSHFEEMKTIKRLASRGNQALDQFVCFLDSGLLSDTTRVTQGTALALEDASPALTVATRRKQPPSFTRKEPLKNTSLWTWFLGITILSILTLGILFAAETIALPATFLAFGLVGGGFLLATIITGCLWIAGFAFNHYFSKSTPALPRSPSSHSVMVQQLSLSPRPPPAPQPVSIAAPSPPPMAQQPTEPLTATGVAGCTTAPAPVESSLAVKLRACFLDAQRKRTFSTTEKIQLHLETWAAFYTQPLAEIALTLLTLHDEKQIQLSPEAERYLLNDALNTTRRRRITLA